MALLLDCVFTGAPAGNLESFAIPGYPQFSWKVVNTGYASATVGAAGATAPEAATTPTSMYMLWDNAGSAPATFDAPLTLEMYTDASGGKAAAYTARIDPYTVDWIVYLASGVGLQYGGGTSIDVRAGAHTGMLSTGRPTGLIGSRSTASGCMVALEDLGGGLTAYRFNGVPEGAYTSYPVIDPAGICFTVEQHHVQRIRVFDNADPTGGGGGGGGDPEPEYWWRDYENADVESKT